jgi:putative Holliday junction resolvase
VPKALAIDYGSKRTGIAISDSTKTIASPHETIHTKDLTQYLKKIIEQENIDVIIIGIPYKLNGEATHHTKAAKDFFIYAQRTFKNVKIEQADERFTSKIAMQALIEAGAKKSTRQNKKNLDKMSAAIILQDYLNRCR